MHVKAGIPASPPRELTPELVAYARKRSKVGFTNAPVVYSMLIIFATLGLSGDIPLLFFSDDPPPLWGYIFIAVFNLLALLALVLLVARKRGNLKRYSFVLREGEPTRASVLAMGLDWQGKVNDQPRSTVDITIAGKSFRLKTFEREILDYCDPGSELDLIWHPDHPGVIIPIVALLPRPPAPEEPETIVI